jgi:hypothetical protein
MALAVVVFLTLTELQHWLTQVQVAAAQAAATWQGVAVMAVLE